MSPCRVLEVPTRAYILISHLLVLGGRERDMQAAE